jgi:hypothetical protein
MVHDAGAHLHTVGSVAEAGVPWTRVSTPSSRMAGRQVGTSVARSALLPLVPVVNAVTPVPVLAAGGIADACDRSSPAHVLRSCLPMIARSAMPAPRLGHVMRVGAFFDLSAGARTGSADGVALRSTW